MGTITIVLDDEVEEKLRKRAHGKGALGKAISEATRQWLEDQEQKQIQQKALKLLRKGFDMGKIAYTKREELHERYYPS